MRKRVALSVLVAICGLILPSMEVSAGDEPAPVILDQFPAPVPGGLVSLGFDSSESEVWGYPHFGANLLKYSDTGTALGSIPRPGIAANNFDLDVALVSFTLGSTVVPAGSLLVIDGESGTADVYAVNPSNGAVIATLDTAFGANEVVGGAYHLARGTLYLIASRSNFGAANVIAEIDPTSGAVLNSFSTTAFGYQVNYGDIDVEPLTGNLLIVSSDMLTILELSAHGELIRTMNLPAGVSSMSALAIVDDEDGQAYVGNTTGSVWLLGGLEEDLIFADGVETNDLSAWISSP